MIAKGYNRMPRTTNVTKQSVTAKVYGYASIKDFTQVTQTGEFGCTIVRLAIKDFFTEEITNGLFNLD